MVEMRIQSRKNNEISVIIVFSVESNREKNVWLCANQTHTHWHPSVFTEHNGKSNFSWACACTSTYKTFPLTLPYQSKHMHSQNHPFSWMAPQDMRETSK